MFEIQRIFYTDSPSQVTDHILSAQQPQMANGTALGSWPGGARKRGLWRHRVADAGMQSREPERVRRQPQQNSKQLFLEKKELLSKKSYTSSFTEGETEAQRGLGTHPTDAKLYRIPGI